MTIPLIFVLSIIILSNFVTLKLVTKRNIRFSYQISISRSELGILKPGDSRLGLLAFKIILDYHYFNTLHNIPIHMNIIWDRLSCWSTGWHCASWFFIVKFLSHAKQNRKKKSKSKFVTWHINEIFTDNQIQSPWKISRPYPRPKAPYLSFHTSSPYGTPYMGQGK